MADFLETFEAHVRADPPRAEDWRVYADWLIDQGDPRGSLMQVQLDLEGALPEEERTRAQEQERRLIEENAESWLGPLGPGVLDGSHQKVVFRRGVLRAIVMGRVTARFVAALRQTGRERLRHLHELRMISHQYLREDDLQEIDGVKTHEDMELYGLLPLEDMPELRLFQAGGDTPGTCSANGETVHEILDRVPTLRELLLEAHRVDVRAVFGASLELRRLVVNHLHDYPLSVLALNPAMHRLEALECWPHTVEHGDGFYIDRTDLEAVATSVHLQSLRELTLKSSSIGDDGIQVLVDSGLLARLRLLDLTHGDVTDRGASLLAEHGSHLEHLSLQANCLSPGGVDLVQRCGIPSLVTAEQFDFEDDGRVYQWYGDIE